MNKHHYLLLFIFPCIILLAGAFPLQAEDRVPRPEFQSGYELPETTTPAPTDNLFNYIDTGVLVIMLGLTCLFALRLRSRKGIFFCSLFSLIYFGFWKKGCICSIGSLQNIVYSLFSGSYTLPIFVALLFILPLIFSLLFGRVYCAGVCPFGALQDLVALKPIKIPTWVEKILGIIPALYLGLAVLSAATGSGFLICQFDPFVGIFRFGARFEMFVAGGIILLAGIFIARPYCRFLCPYGVLLKWASRISQWHIAITEEECVECRLCETTCPVGAIQKPSPALKIEKREKGVKRLMILCIIMPVVILGTGFLFSKISHVFAQLHPEVRLAGQILKEDSGITESATDASEAFRGTGTPFEFLFTKANQILSQFHTGSWLLGGYIGLIIMTEIISLSVLRKKTEYTIDKGACINCGRCLPVCPKEQMKKKR